MSQRLSGKKAVRRSMTAARRRGRTSVLLNLDWDNNEAFSMELDLASCGRAEIIEALKGTSVRGGCRGRGMLSTEQMREKAATLGVHHVKLRGLQALRYRAGVVVQYLARLEGSVGPGAMAGLALARRTSWTMVAKAPRGGPVTVGSVVSAIDGESVLLDSYEETQAKLASADRITFRRAPFHQGWTRVDSEAMEPAVCYLVLAYGVVAYFDREKAPRTRLGLMPLAGASVQPTPCGGALLLKHPTHGTLELAPPHEHRAEWAPFVPAIDLAAVGAGIESSSRLRCSTVLTRGLRLCFENSPGAIDSSNHQPIDIDLAPTSRLTGRFPRRRPCSASPCPTPTAIATCGPWRCSARRARSSSRSTAATTRARAVPRVARRPRRNPTRFVAGSWPR